MKGFMEASVRWHGLVVLHFYYLKEHKKIYGALVEEMKRLKNNQHIIHRHADDRSRGEEKCHIQDWLDKAEGIERDIVSIKKEIEQRKMNMNPWLAKHYLSYKLGKMAQDKLNEMIEHNAKIPLDQEELSSSCNGNLLMEFPITASENEVCSHERMQTILNYVEDDQNPKIGIYGMGGIGKTTLVRHVHERVQGFDPIIFATVSKEPNLQVLQRNIATALDISLPAESTSEDIALRIYIQLKHRKYLLILDDVWGELDLTQLGIPDPTNGNGCKIILTTRSLHVCNSMQTGVQIKIEPMTKSEAWDLLRKKAGDVILKDSIQPIAEETMEECGGLPLAIVTLGGALRNKSTTGPWNEALRELRLSSGETVGMELAVFQSLKFSYDYLKGVDLKKLFLYCCLFPEDCDIDIRSLKDICYFDRVLNYVSSHFQSHSRIDKIIEKLKELSLLESGFVDNYYVKMHDLVRDMALWITSEGEGPRFYVKAGVGLTEVPEDEVDWEEVEIISLMMNDLQTLPDEPKGTKVRMLLLGQNSGLRSIPFSFFVHMDGMQVLDLSDTAISSLPPSISLLKKLKVLLLTNCEHLEDVQPLAALTQLLHLKLDGTAIKELPAAMKGMRSLRLLSLHGTRHLSKIAHNLLSGMNNLQKLDMGMSYRRWVAVGRYAVSSGVHLSELLCMKHLRYLEITIESNIETLEWMLRSRLTRVLKGLHIISCEGLVEIQSCHLSSLASLSILGISCCSDLERIGTIGDNEELPFTDLVHLGLIELPKLESIWEGLESPRSFQNLEVVVIDRCHSLKSFISLNSVLQLKKLCFLTISNCTEMEEIIDAEVGEENPLPNLNALRILKLPKLTRICTAFLTWTSLKHVDVEECPQLKAVPFNSHNARSLKIAGERGWWETLQWEDEETKTSVQKNFIPSD
uniref:Uncharacterized protein n=2 Tax=Nymphaea colorata TaxID=210225 RepID=A0A5K1E0K2_9MAGN